MKGRGISNLKEFFNSSPSPYPLPSRRCEKIPFSPHPVPPPSRGRKFIINFNLFTLSPAGRGQGEGAKSNFFTPSLCQRGARGGSEISCQFGRKIISMRLKPACQFRVLRKWRDRLSWGPHDAPFFKELKCCKPGGRFRDWGSLSLSRSLRGSF